ncbi:NDK domain-containing protein, partial [Haematococcus lacustris]
MAWDVAFSRGLLHKRVEYSQVEDHMSLRGVLQVSLGLSAPWQGGRAGRLPALWELLHELGHGLHLLMAGHRCCWGQGGALGLPLELLEVPSTLCEHLLTCPTSLSAICRYDPTASDPE